MARQNKDVFGFDELEKSLKRFEKLSGQGRCSFNGTGTSSQ